MTPKIQFHRSHVYDEHLVKPDGFAMPSDEFIYKNTRKLELKWRKIEKKVLEELEAVTGLSWRESHIYVYITSGVGWFSAPLTMSITEDIDFLLHTLVHELIHRITLENENWPIIKERWFKLMEKYQKENFNTRIHVPIHAIHKHLYLKLFSQKELDQEIEKMRGIEDYARSWSIVQSEDYREIIRALNPKFKG